MLTTNFALAQGHGNRHGKGHDKHRDDDASYYKEGDRDAVRGWCEDHENHPPPGLVKKDRWPPGLEKQLVRRVRSRQASRSGATGSKRPRTRATSATSGVRSGSDRRAYRSAKPENQYGDGRRPFRNSLIEFTNSTTCPTLRTRE
jgi:hypothetical protein